MSLKPSSSAAALVTQLRARLSDDSHTRPAFKVFLDDTAATDASLEIRHGRFTTNVVNARRNLSLNLDLSDFQYDTVGKLVARLQARTGYTVVPDDQMDADHPSVDLKVRGFGDLIEGGLDLAHRRFSDKELGELLTQAVHRHNVSYTLHTVPSNEHIFVLQLAHAEAIRVLATNAVKRRGLEQTVSDLLSLAESYEKAYRDDVKRQQRPIPVAKIKDDDTGSGDILQGELFRRSARTGFNAPMGSNPPPEIPTLRDPRDEDVTDTTIRLTWRGNKEYDFYAYELWRDTDEQNLKRLRAGNMVRRPSSGGSIVEREQYTTSKLVFQSFGANSNFDTVGFATFVEEFGQLIESFVDGDTVSGRTSSNSPTPLEPEQTYYYRLFVVDLNYKTVGSSIVRAKTKSLRARATQGSPIDIVSGSVAGGDTITLSGERFHTGMKVKLGDKFVGNLTIGGATSATFTTPALSNPDAVGKVYDLVIISKDGQRDIHPQQWTYTA